MQQKKEVTIMENAAAPRRLISPSPPTPTLRIHSVTIKENDGPKRGQEKEREKPFI